LYTKAIDADPKASEAYLWRGRCYLKLKDYGRAIRDFNRAIELGPLNGERFYWLAYSESIVKMDSMAILHYNRAQDYQPDESSFYTNRGIIYIKQGKFINARADFREAVRLNPDDSTYFNLALSEYRIGDYVNSLQHINQAIPIYRLPDAIALRGRIYPAEQLCGCDSRSPGGTKKRSR
jgi:tetratricopeptide (TPR) repeat protein